ncbi:hypothetical protein [Paenibacillus physcomitrellae]|uniref:Uncharacterized protein n=1 Tax=Paenibacillus physcomitrellae TaxID=1619311 RepID=A0ABQ1GYM1_9BACL|nr:hypothetical protein [Paenibacillus physcomitrellae]GGA53047.1 hypothetical protein GCM10010917_42840 [Paenibacillus physcomitrellae]
MGVKHGRDYALILADLTEAVAAVPDSYIFFEMDLEDWERLPQEDRSEVWEALAEDLFYGLGEQPVITVGSAVVMHDPAVHRINVLIGEEELTSISLI